MEEHTIWSLERSAREGGNGDIPAARYGQMLVRQRTKGTCSMRGKTSIEGSQRLKSSRRHFRCWLPPNVICASTEKLLVFRHPMNSNTIITI
jgi:hypothetical protein